MDEFKVAENISLPQKNRAKPASVIRMVLNSLEAVFTQQRFLICQDGCCRPNSPNCSPSLLRFSSFFRPFTSRLSKVIGKGKKRSAVRRCSLLRSVPASLSPSVSRQLFQTCFRAQPQPNMGGGGGKHGRAGSLPYCTPQSHALLKAPLFLSSS